MDDQSDEEYNDNDDEGDDDKQRDNIRQLTMTTEEGNDDNDDEGGDGGDGDDNWKDMTENLMKNVMITNANDKKQKRFRKYFLTDYELPVSYESKDGYLQLIGQCFLTQRFSYASRLAAAMAIDHRMPQSLFVSAAFVLNAHMMGGDTTRLTQTMKKFASFDVNKCYIMLEMIIAFIRSGQRTEAKAFVEANEVYLRCNRFKRNSIIDTYLKCFIYLLDYLEIKESTLETRSGVSTMPANRLLVQKIKLNFTNIISETKDKNICLEMFLLLLVEVYEMSQQYADAVDILTTFIDNNAEYLNSHLYLYNFGLKYPSYVTDDQMVGALKNIAKYSPNCCHVLDLVARHVLPVDEEFALLLNYLDFTTNSNDTKAWTLLRQLVDSIDNRNDETSDDSKSVKEFWHKYRYDRNWHRIHCRKLPADIESLDQLVDSNVIEIIKCKQSVIKYFYGSDHESHELIGKFLNL